MSDPTNEPRNLATRINRHEGPYRCDCDRCDETEMLIRQFLLEKQQDPLREPTPPTHRKDSSDPLVSFAENYLGWMLDEAINHFKEDDDQWCVDELVRRLEILLAEPTPPVDPPSEDWRKLAILRRAVMSVCDEALFKLTPEQVQGFMGQWIARLAGALVEIGISGPGDE